MIDPVEAAARSAAERLNGRYGPGLPSEVEAVLLDTQAGGGPRQYVDPISLASLVVSVAGLAWSIYSDQRSRGPDPAASDLVTAVRSALRSPDHAGPVPQEEIIEIVVTEVTRVAVK
jgi:hypothetical protein